jgi:hypothetical protein
VLVPWCFIVLQCCSATVLPAVLSLCYVLILQFYGATVLRTAVNTFAMLWCYSAARCYSAGSCGLMLRCCSCFTVLQCCSAYSATVLRCCSAGAGLYSAMVLQCCGAAVATVAGAAVLPDAAVFAVNGATVLWCYGAAVASVNGALRWRDRCSATVLRCYGYGAAVLHGAAVLRCYSAAVLRVPVLWCYSATLTRTCCGAADAAVLLVHRNVWCFAGAAVTTVLQCCSYSCNEQRLTTVLLVLQCCCYAGAFGACGAAVLHGAVVSCGAAVAAMLGALALLRCCSWHHGAAVL